MWRISCLFCLLLGFGNPVLAALAEVVWTEFDGNQHHILLSRYDGDAWSQPGERIYSSNNALATPVLGTAHSGDKILVWAEVTRGKVVLMTARARATEKTLAWQPAERFSDRGLENLGPVIVTDLRGHLWVFWSSSTRSPSELYYRKYDGNGWSEARGVHAANEVPDNGAVASLDQRGNVVVEWNTFDLDLGTYVLESRTFLVENRKPAQPQPVDVTDPSAIPLPDFLPVNARSLLHFPGNLRTQGLVVGQPEGIPGLQ